MTVQQVYEWRDGNYRFHPEPIDGAPWWEWAECLGENTEIFFEDHVHAQREALRFCNRCPVRSECLEDTLEREHRTPRDYTYGIFGGATPKERHKIKRRRHEPAY